MKKFGAINIHAQRANLEHQVAVVKTRAGTLPVEDVCAVEARVVGKLPRDDLESFCK